MTNVHDKIFFGIEKQAIQKSKIIEIVNKIDYLKTQKPTYIGSNFENSIQLIRDENYYIVFDKVVIKGKQRIFKGEIIEVNKNQLLFFIENAMKGLSERRYYLIPLNLSYLLKISEEGGIYSFEA